MPKAAFIGDTDLVRAFGLVGAAVFPVDKKEQIPAILENAAKGDCNIVFILEKWATRAPDAIEAYKNRFASIVVIPDYRQDFGACREKIKNAIIEAVGADILKENAV